MQSVDGYMNIALEKTEEYVNGKLRRNYGDAFVRGNNGSSITFFLPILRLARWLSDQHLQYSTSLPAKSKNTLFDVIDWAHL